MSASRPIATLGRGSLAVAREVGGIGILAGQVARALVPPSMDGRELLRNLYKMGNRSVPIVALTAFFVGGIMVIQSGVFVERFGATGLVGWGAGYAIFREVGPVLIALMFSGRVGSNNTAERGTMVVTEQIDGLRALAVDPLRYLIVPRVVAMTIMLLALTILGNLVALAGGALFSSLLLDVSPSIFYHSLVDNLRPEDLIHGLIKAVAFGVAIARTSCHFGLGVRGGAVGVGRAVNAAVVAAAISIMVLDFFVTYLIG
jgi:phospholipid/cholesterol/gamma-HCH transport system permease protein